MATAGIRETGPAADVMAFRSNIFEMTAVAERAVLRPKETGRWPHPLRAALAARIAALNGFGDLAVRYASEAGGFAELANPARNGAAEGLGPVLAFMDKVAVETRNVVATDISALQDAGVADADIVRLSELNAFLAYKIRVVAGLRLMTEGSP
ncbi:MAG: hypothetical protein F4Y60_01545 [Boseongicola sp. SB0664_bin_43]|uniref:CMD domain protein n=1 Tax=Boseongicola sp. SB0664_bin_43 TaxID=2604844 RepID=A0A6B0Y192_9RHOB|nr:hypothetical protein [Boseongicola sp. SB0664_bin_43]